MLSSSWMLPSINWILLTIKGIISKLVATPTKHFIHQLNHVYMNKNKLLPPSVASSSGGTFMETYEIIIQVGNAALKNSPRFPPLVVKSLICPTPHINGASKNNNKRAKKLSLQSTSYSDCVFVATVKLVSGPWYNTVHYPSMLSWQHSCLKVTYYALLYLRLWTQRCLLLQVRTSLEVMLTLTRISRHNWSRDTDWNVWNNIFFKYTSKKFRCTHRIKIP